ncbi:MAG: diphosphate--fructose-6-phosphate 1-phosphotransferase, partial [Abditibacteriota bacterium]|nr:diphosphate--fructose-6-phosphate 1-phosphotransferase [Abditibacteriota bacterium]
GYHGIEGVLKEELINISAQEDEEISLLRTTPAAGSIGTCRYKLKGDKQQDFDRVLEVIKAHNIGYFFYIGGNDSMDTANKVSILAKERGIELIATGVPKTIDNDLGDDEEILIDHTPGYGSCAKYWASYIQQLNEENTGSSPSDPVTIVQAMGRKIGFIAAAARLADPKREMALQIYMAECGWTLPDIADSINDILKERGRVIIVANEGLELSDIGAQNDDFGHIVYAASKSCVAQEIANYLNDVGLPIRGAAHWAVPGCDQRNSIIFASNVDLNEAYNLGLKAVEIAIQEGSGYMATLLRVPGDIYNVYYDKVPLGKMANSEKHFPPSWIAENKLDVTDDYVKYARPLIGDSWVSVPMVDGIMRLARFKPIFAEKCLKDYALS